MNAFDGHPPLLSVHFSRLDMLTPYMAHRIFPSESHLQAWWNLCQSCGKQAFIQTRAS
jgi:hypothetical protein